MHTGCSDEPGLKKGRLRAFEHVDGRFAFIATMLPSAASRERSER